MSQRWPVRVSVLTAAAVAFWMVTAAAQGGGGGRGGGGAQGPGGAGGGRGADPTAAGRGGPGGPGGRGGQQSTAVGTAGITGVVVVDGSGSPVRRARVSLAGTELRGTRTVTTDDSGRFTFPALPAGRFTMTASKPGYVDNAYGAKRPGRPGTPIQLADGQRIEKTVINLPKGSVVTGTVVDEHGEPSAGTQVRALRYVLRTGEKTLQQAGQDTTDDRGIYRIYQLQPGDYVVNALPRNQDMGDLGQAIHAQISSLVQQGQTARGGGAAAPGNLAGLASLMGNVDQQQLNDRIAQLQNQLAQQGQAQGQSAAYAPVYFPGTTSASGATTVTLAVGEERPGVDFQLQLVPTSKVEGSVTSPDGILPQGAQVSLVAMDRGPGGGGLGANISRVGAGGRFTFSNVTPGEYTLQARAAIRDQTGAATDPQLQGRGGRGGPGAPGGPGGAILQVLWASTTVSASGQDVSGVNLNLQPGMTISGRVEFQGAQPPADLSRVRVSITARGSQGFEMGATPPAQTDASGRFTLTGVAPGQYTLSATLMGAAQPVAAGAAAAAGRGAAGGAGAGAAAAGGRGAAAGGRGGAVGTVQGAAQWTLKAAVVNGRDVLDFPLEVAPSQDLTGVLLSFSDKSQELRGTIQDTSGRPTSDYTIIVFPSDKRFWLPQARRIVSTRPGTDGTFSFRSLPAGDYRITAVTDVEPGEWYDPDFLNQLNAVSIPIAIAEGEKKQQDIRLAGQ